VLAPASCYSPQRVQQIQQHLSCFCNPLPDLVSRLKPSLLFSQVVWRLFHGLNVSKLPNTRETIPFLFTQEHNVGFSSEFHCLKICGCCCVLNQCKASISRWVL
jgi:hypothetical protein